MRGTEVPYCPVFFAYMVITLEDITLFIDEAKIDNEQAQAHLKALDVCLRPYEELWTYLEGDIKGTVSLFSARVCKHAFLTDELPAAAHRLRRPLRGRIHSHPVSVHGHQLLLCSRSQGYQEQDRDSGLQSSVPKRLGRLRSLGERRCNILQSVYCIRLCSCRETSYMLSWPGLKNPSSRRRYPSRNGRQPKS